MTTDITVILCAYTEDRWAAMLAAVDSVQRQSLPPREIILVVDHNPPLLRRARGHLPHVVVVSNDGPRGLSGARNAGLALAQGAIVAFMDEDAVAAPDWLSRLSAGYEDERVMGVGGTVEPVWLTGRPSWFPEEFDWVVGCSYRGLPEAPAPVRNLIGCNMSLRREVFAAVGGFRSGMGRVGTVPLGCEETELCIRARQRWPQRVLLFDPRARVAHRVPAARASWRYFIARCYAEGRSKALVSHFVGARQGLASERAHALRTLPRGIARGLADASLRGDVAGLGRSGAIVAGLVLTAGGYATGRAADRLARQAVRAPQPPLIPIPPEGRESLALSGQERP